MVRRRVHTLKTRLIVLLHKAPRGSKRQRDLSPIPPSSPPQPTRRGSSLPPSSPPAPFSDTDDSLDDRDAVRDVDDNDAEEDADGEDLFGETLQEYVVSV